MRCCRPKRMSCSEGCDMFSTFTLCCTILCLRDGCYEFACDSRSTHWRAPEKMFVEIVPLMQCALQYPIEERFQCHMKVMHILNDASALSGSSVGKLCENLHLRYGWRCSVHASSSQTDEFVCRIQMRWTFSLCRSYSVILRPVKQWVPSSQTCPLTCTVYVYAYYHY